MFSNTSFGKDLNCPTKALPSHILDRAARLQQLNCRLYLRINNKKNLLLYQHSPMVAKL